MKDQLSHVEAHDWAKLVYGERGAVRETKGLCKVGIESETGRFRLKGFGATWTDAVVMAGMNVRRAM